MKKSFSPIIMSFLGRSGEEDAGVMYKKSVSLALTAPDAQCVYYLVSPTPVPPPFTTSMKTRSTSPRAGYAAPPLYTRSTQPR